LVVQNETIGQLTIEVIFGQHVNMRSVAVH
jgi:hypothetical protein